MEYGNGRCDASAGKLIALPTASHNTHPYHSAEY